MIGSGRGQLSSAKCDQGEIRAYCPYYHMLSQASGEMSGDESQ